MQREEWNGGRWGKSGVRETSMEVAAVPQVRDDDYFAGSGSSGDGQLVIESRNKEEELLFSLPPTSPSNL